MRGAASLAAAALASMTPALAAACPYCASQGNSGNGQTIALGAFILLPFLVTGTILKVIRSQDSMGPQAASRPGTPRAADLTRRAQPLNETSNQAGSRRIAE
jgi:hypothetical protein